MQILRRFFSSPASSTATPSKVEPQQPSANTLAGILLRLFGAEKQYALLHACLTLMVMHWLEPIDLQNLLKKKTAGVLDSAGIVSEIRSLVQKRAGAEFSQDVFDQVLGLSESV